MKRAEPNRSPGRATRQRTSKRQAPESSEPVRLQKYMADCGLASRRKSEELIAAGRVRVNGKVVKELGTKIVPRTDKITVDGNVVRDRSHGRLAYYVMNKPRGFLVTANDPERRKTIYDLLTDVKERVVPVGRLDRDSEGLLLLTNDGDLAYRLMHPKYKVEKEYEVRLNGRVHPGKVANLREGVEIESGKTQAAQVQVLDENENGTRLAIIITEGRKRQIRQMCEALGFEVRRLFRVREGKIVLGRLRPGQHRKLTEQEVRQLRKDVGLE
ncbi:MAG: pseudouridine synthase [Candidatus Sumerlaeaceae bacterium]